MERRQFLTIIGGGIIAAAAVGVAGFAMTRRPDRALRPWDMAGSGYAEPRRRALSYAILAPNPHNRQPWLIDLSTPGAVNLFVDTNRLLPHTDPFSRQITIGLGCFMEVMSIAASNQAQRLEMEIFPEGFDNKRLDQRVVARIRFVDDRSITPDPQFASILLRRTLKEPFDLTKPVGAEVLASLKAVQLPSTRIGASNDADMVALLRALTVKALEVELDTPRTYKESVDLFRIGKAEIEANPDGIDLGGPLFDSLQALGQLSREQALDVTSSVYAQGRDAVLENARTAMGHLWLTTPGNSRTDQITAGRAWARINLTTTVLGVGLQPLSQVLQEYAEMEEHYRAAHKLLAKEGETVQMLGRLGYAPGVDPSPRWPLEAKII